MPCVSAAPPISAQSSTDLSDNRTDLKADTMDVLTTPFLTGTATGAILLLAALGLTLTFGQMGVINMANGEFLMVGAYVAYSPSR